MGESVLQLKWSKLLSFEEEKINKLDENVEGVFRISKKDDNDEKYYVVFVGSSKDVKKELLELISESQETESVLLRFFMKQGGEFAFRYAEIKGADNRSAVEKQMYRQYAPEYNLREPSSTLDVEVNLS